MIGLVNLIKLDLIILLKASIQRLNTLILVTLGSLDAFDGANCPSPPKSITRLHIIEIRKKNIKLITLLCYE